jgi:tetratricopeptide (TPR) repeat protein
MPFVPRSAGSTRQEASGVVERAIEQCRKGNWEQGLPYLGQYASSEDRASLPGLFYSYLGYGIALREQRLDEGLKLCKHAIKIEFYHPENYWNLARLCLLARDRKGAVKAVRDGLKIDPHSPELLDLYKEMGMRRSPVLSFLSRDNPLNRMLGSLRHKLTGEPVVASKPAASSAAERGKAAGPPRG